MGLSLSAGIGCRLTWKVNLQCQRQKGHDVTLKVNDLTCLQRDGYILKKGELNYFVFMPKLSTLSAFSQLRDQSFGTAWSSFIFSERKKGQGVGVNRHNF